MPDDDKTFPGGAFIAPEASILSGLLLVGTVHDDPAGFQRVCRLLRCYRPRVILVEISPYSFAHRKAHGHALRKSLSANVAAAAAEADMEPERAARHPRIAGVRRQLGMPFEYRAGEAFSREAGAELHAVDDSIFSRRWISTWSDLISTRNLAILLSLSPEARSTARAYEEARRRIEGTAPSTRQELREWSDEDEQLWRRRERVLAENVTRVLTQSRPERSVYLGGWQRLVPDGRFPSLRRLLGVEPSRCLLLDRVEGIPGGAFA